VDEPRRRGEQGVFTGLVTANPKSQTPKPKSKDSDTSHRDTEAQRKISILCVSESLWPVFGTWDLGLGTWDLGFGIWDLRRTRPLNIQVHRIQRLACAHEEPVALRPAEGDVRADFRQADAADEFSGRIPDGDAAITELTSCVAPCQEIAVHVDANAVRSALDAVDHEIAEQLRRPEAVVGTDVEDVDAAIAAAPCVAREFRKADDVDLLLIG